MVRCGPSCKFVRREPVEARARALPVVVVPPFGQRLADVRQAAEHRLVEELGITSKRTRLDHTVDPVWIFSGGFDPSIVHKQTYGGQQIDRRTCRLARRPSPAEQSWLTMY